MKNLLNLGKTLNKAEQKLIFGGTRKDLSWEPAPPCDPHTVELTTCLLYEGDGSECPDGSSCTPFGSTGGVAGNYTLTGICSCD